MKLLTDEMLDVINDAMDAYAEADDKNVLRYADRLFATVEAALSIAKAVYKDEKGIYDEC